MRFDGSCFDEDYFQRGLQTGKSLYENYRWLPELTIPMAMSMIDYLNIHRHASVLDYGSCYGMLVKAMRLLCRDAYGCDISEHAIISADHDIKQYMKLIDDDVIPFDHQFDFCIAKDVLEHIPYEQINFVLHSISQKCKTLFIIIPLGDGEKFIIPQMEIDKTHIIRQPMDWWINKALQYFHIGSTEYIIEGIKENWTGIYPKGNGFLKLTSKQ